MGQVIGGGSSLTIGLDYPSRSQDVPASPTEGYRWTELNGSNVPIYDWEWRYDATNSIWRSPLYHSSTQSLGGSTSISATQSNFFMCGSGIANNLDLFLDSASMTYDQISSPNDATDNWELTVITRNDNAAVTNRQNTSAALLTADSVFLSLNLLLTVPTVIEGRATKNNSPGNLRRPVITIAYCFARPTA